MERDSLSQNYQRDQSPIHPESMNYYGSFIFPIFTLLLATTCFAISIYTIIYNLKIFTNSYIPEYLLVSGIVLLIDFSMMLIQSIFRRNGILCRSDLLSRIIRWLLLIGYSVLIIFGLISCLHIDGRINNGTNSELSIAFFSTYCFIVFRAVMEIISFIIFKVIQKNERILISESVDENKFEINTAQSTNRNNGQGIASEDDKEKDLDKDNGSNLNSRNTTYRELESREGGSSPGSPETYAKDLRNGYFFEDEDKYKENEGENLISVHSSSNLITGNQLVSSGPEQEATEINLFQDYKQKKEEEIDPLDNFIKEDQESERIGYETEVGYVTISQNQTEREEKQNLIIMTLQTSEHEKTDSSISLSFQDRTF